MLKLACKYMRYYKSQTFAILASIILTASLLSGISSLLYSSQKSELANKKIMYGDWHYRIWADQELAGEVQRGDAQESFRPTQIGIKEIRRIVREPYQVAFVSADESYMEMTHRSLTAGRYPQRADEIAADQYTLRNLGILTQPGSRVILYGEEYTLTGIVKGEWSSETDEMEIFVGDAFAGEGKQTCLYLRFKEDGKLYRQLQAFQETYRVSSEWIEANEEVVSLLGGEKPDSIYDIVKFALTDERGNFTYIVLKLQSEYNLALNGMIFLLCLFSLCVIYSIFNISAAKRTSEYGLMQTLGISGARIGGTLVFELWILFLIGYPVGCLVGNGVLNVLYQGMGAVYKEKTSGMEEAQAGEFHIAWQAMAVGFIFLFAAMAVIGFVTIRSMQKESLLQTMAGDTSFVGKSRKIYGKRHRNLANVVVRKFMFSNKKKALGILISLSIGGCVFLCATYMVENLKIHAEMSMKSDDGLGSLCSEYRVSLKSGDLSDTIPREVIDEVRNIPGLAQVYASKYSLGELTIQKNELKWDEYFDEMNQDAYYQQRFGGICVEKEDGTYGIKYDVYGYDEGMMKQLREFVLEGEISLDDLEKGNKIIVVANKDGQGNYDFYGRHPGDTVTVRVPKDLDCAKEVLKFRGEEEYYIEKEFEIAAVVSRALAQEEGFLNAEGWNGCQSLIMTNGQMEEQYGILDYRFIHASASDGADTEAVSASLLDIIGDVPKAVLKDYKAAIETQKNYLGRQQLFFTGVAAILLIISLFHIMNSVNYSILSRRREYGIIRAMGITDSGFYRMILRTGIGYGLLADLFIFLFYNIVLRRVMDYYMAHVVQFLHFTAKVPAGITAMVMLLNLLLSVTAVMVPARKIIRTSIVSEISM